MLIWLILHYTVFFHIFLFFIFINSLSSRGVLYFILLTTVYRASALTPCVFYNWFFMFLTFSHFGYMEEWELKIDRERDTAHSANSKIWPDRIRIISRILVRPDNFRDASKQYQFSLKNRKDVFFLYSDIIYWLVCNIRNQVGWAWSWISTASMSPW